MGKTALAPEQTAKFVAWYCEARHVGFKEIARLSISSHANRFAWFAQNESYKSTEAPARFSTLDCPMQIEPMDEITNPEVQVHCWMWASRMGKTRMWINAVGYFIDHDPATQMAMYPTQQDADSEAKERLQPMLDATPALQGKVSEAKAGSGNNTIRLKKFRGGFIAYVGSNAPSKLRRRAARILFADEIDSYAESSGREGDPLSLLFVRSKNYQRPVRIISSTPTIKNHSAIEKWYQRSDQRQWFCPCLKCGQFQTLKWSQFKWPADERHKTKYHCEVCGYAHNEAQRDRMIRRGQWRATAPFVGVRGYFLPGFYSIFPHAESFKGKMHEFAEEVFTAKHSSNRAQTVRVMVNTFFAESYEEEQNVKQEWRTLYDRREDYFVDGKIPLGVKLVTAGVDFQIDRAEIEFIGWGDNEESWGLGNVAIFGDFRMPASYPQLDSQMTRIFEREDGARLPVVASGWDTGYSAAQRALYTYLRPRFGRRFYAMKGASVKWAPAFVKGRREERITLFLIGTNRLKSFIYNRATIATVGPGYMHFPKDEALGYNEEWFKQVLAEDSHSEFAAGLQMTIFEMPTTPPEDGTSHNEALDKRVYAQAALYIRGPVNWELEEKRCLATIPVLPDDNDAPKKREKLFEGARHPTGDPEGFFKTGWNL